MVKNQIMAITRFITYNDTDVSTIDYFRLLIFKKNAFPCKDVGGRNVGVSKYSGNSYKYGEGYFYSHPENRNSAVRHSFYNE